MQFQMEINEDEIQSDISDRISAKVEKQIETAIDDWKIREVIREKVEEQIKIKLDAVIAELIINTDEKEFTNRVSKVVDAVIKSKVKKNLK